MSKIRLPLLLLLSAAIAWLIWRWQRSLAEQPSLTLPNTASRDELPFQPALTGIDEVQRKNTQPVPMREISPRAPIAPMPQIAPSAPVIPMPQVTPGNQPSAPKDTNRDRADTNGTVTLVGKPTEQPDVDVQSANGVADPSDVESDIQSLSDSPSDSPLDLNSATLDELIALPRIGPALAQRIIDYRTDHGPFTSVEQLIDIQGIGPNNIHEFAHLLTVNSSQSDVRDEEV